MDGRHIKLGQALLQPWRNARNDQVSRHFLEKFSMNWRVWHTTWVNTRENRICFYAIIFTASAWAAPEYACRIRRNALMRKYILPSL